jgi:hypothetical protein
MDAQTQADEQFELESAADPPKCKVYNKQVQHYPAQSTGSGRTNSSAWKSPAVLMGTSSAC